MKFGDSEVTLGTLLKDFKEGLARIIGSGQNLLYSSDWYLGSVEAILSAGGTMNDLKKVEDDVVEAYYSNKAKPASSNQISDAA